MPLSHYVDDLSADRFLLVIRQTSFSRRPYPPGKLQSAVRRHFRFPRSGSELGLITLAAAFCYDPIY